MNPLAAHADTLTLALDGAERLHGAITPQDLDAILRAVADLPPDRAGIRLHGIVALRPLLAADGPVGRLASGCHPVRALPFDKTAATNWALAWHQDRTIAVVKQVEVEHFGPWTVKRGMVHVAPPFDVLAAMLTLRVHLDPVTADNAPLLVAPGSHRLGRIPEREVRDVVRRCGTVMCLADAGDAWLYATPILHASDAALRPTRRRVLQVDYAVAGLPGGLQWLGV